MPLGPPRVIGFPGLWGPKAPGLWDPEAPGLWGPGALGPSGAPLGCRARSTCLQCLYGKEGPDYDYDYDYDYNYDYESMTMPIIS